MRGRQSIWKVDGSIGYQKWVRMTKLEKSQIYLLKYWSLHLSKSVKSATIVEVQQYEVLGTCKLFYRKFFVTDEKQKLKFKKEEKEKKKIS